MANPQIELSLISHPSQQIIAGVDEVGRGPLCGDVVAAAVVLPNDHGLPLKDSKKLTEKAREALSEEIMRVAQGYAIAVATPEEIDAFNILQATMLAMSRALARLPCPYNHIMVDGNRCPKVEQSCEAVVKGDDKIAQISAASILAKVYRDRQMQQWHERHPEYGFDQHKGYPTKLHLEKIAQLGLIDGYRKSFRPVRALLKE